jgi:phosphonate transport system substrate-binding protein
VAKARYSCAVLRFLTYLAPGLPEMLFQEVCARVGRVVGVETDLRVESRQSGPEPNGRDPFSSGGADVGFMCAPPFQWLCARPQPPVELCPVGLAFDEPRLGGQPLYFSDIVVAAASAHAGFPDLRGARFAYNDPASLSGYRCLLGKLAALGETTRFFSGLERSGSHLASLAGIAAGDVDAAAIDSNVLRIALARDPGLATQVRVIESWGPYPIQPIALRTSLDPALKRAIIGALRGWTRAASDGAALADYGVLGLAPVDAARYAASPPLGPVVPAAALAVAGTA